MAEKKKRGVAFNFTEAEEVFLVKLVISVKDVLISKKSDQFTNKQKNEQWRNLAATFNAQCSSVSGFVFVCVFCVCVLCFYLFVFFCFFPQQRDWVQLRDKFYKMKKALRSEAAESKNEIFQTGGGSKKRKALLIDRDPIFLELEALMHTSVHGMAPMVGDDNFVPAGNTTQQPIVVAAQPMNNTPQTMPEPSNETQAPDNASAALDDNGRITPDIFSSEENDLEIEFLDYTVESINGEFIVNL